MVRKVACGALVSIGFLQDGLLWGMCELVVLSLFFGGFVYLLQNMVPGEVDLTEGRMAFTSVHAVLAPFPTQVLPLVWRNHQLPLRRKFQCLDWRFGLDFLQDWRFPNVILLNRRGHRYR